MLKFVFGMAAAVGAVWIGYSGWVAVDHISMIMHDVSQERSR